MARGALTAVCALALAAAAAAAADCPAERAQALHDEARLHADLLCDYSTDYRPVRDHKQAVDVKVRFALKYMTFDALEETVIVHSWVALAWSDVNMHWEPAQYGGIAETQLASHEIWTPELSLFNADASVYTSDSFYTTCLVTSAGAVTCVPQLAHYAVCRSKLARWPFDEQECALVLGAWMHTGEQVNFTFYENQPVLRDDFQDGAGWRLTKVAYDRSTPSINNGTYPMLRYTFTLRREAAGPAALVLAPSVAVVPLTLATFLLDARGSARPLLAGFSVMLHLSLLSEIGYNMPKHSAEPPRLLLFARDSLLLSAAALLGALLLAALCRRAAPAPGWARAAAGLLQRSAARYVVFAELQPEDAKPLAEPQDEERARAAADWIQIVNLLNSFFGIVALITYIVLMCVYIPSE